MLIHSEFQLPVLTAWKRARMLRAATQVLETQHHMVSHKNKNILHYTLNKKRKYLHMNHYPKGDRIDYSTGAQYFYHCHRENFESMEHGHFHCYLRYKNIPNRIKPVFKPDFEKDSPMTHLVAIAMNRFGHPIRLFTVNRWVSSEVWYAAKHAPMFLNRFKMTLNDDPYWSVLDKWVEGMLQLFSPQIIWLLNARDNYVIYRETISDNIYYDESVEELSEINIDLNQQIQWLINAPAMVESTELVE